MIMVESADADRLFLRFGQLVFFCVAIDIFTNAPRSSHVFLTVTRFVAFITSVLCALEPSPISVLFAECFWVVVCGLIWRERNHEERSPAPAKAVSFAPTGEEGGRSITREWSPPVVPTVESERIRHGIERLLEVEKAVDGQDGWRHVGSKKTTWGIVSWRSKAHETQRPAMNSVKGRFPGPVNMWAATNSDKDLILRLEPSMNTLETLETLGPQTHVKHLKMKSIFWTTPRDSVYVQHVQVQEDGAVIQLRYSVEHPKAPPSEGGKYVRAEQSLGGYIARPSQDGKSCEVTQVMDIDIKLPEMPPYVARKLDDFNAKLLSNSILERQKLVTKGSEPWTVARYTSLVPPVTNAKDNTGGAFVATPPTATAKSPPSELLNELQKPVQSFNPALLEGRWYEIATVRGHFQKGLVGSVCDYTWNGTTLEAELINWKSSALDKTSNITSSTANSHADADAVPSGHWPARVAVTLKINIGFMKVCPVNITPGYNMTVRGLAGKGESKYDIAYFAEDGFARMWLYAREKRVDPELVSWVFEDCTKAGMDVSTISMTEHFNREYPL